jgi:hypothetical protein
MNRGSKISHSASVRLLEYGIVARLDGFKHLKAEAGRCQMGSIWQGKRILMVLLTVRFSNGRG